MTRQTTALILGTWIALLAPVMLASAQDRTPSILVGGRWVIEVRNPDGTAVERREFDNHLAPTSGFLFQCLFLRNCALGLYSIELSTSTASEYPSPFGNNGGHDHNEPVSRVITESTPNGNVPAGSLEHPANNNRGGFLLAGSTTAVVAGWITDVSTGFSTCPVTVAPADCTDARAILHFLRLTTKAISPLHLEAGQVVDVKVNISFASASIPR